MLTYNLSLYQIPLNRNHTGINGWVAKEVMNKNYANLMTRLVMTRYNPK